MSGTASVLLHRDVVSYLAAERHSEIDIISTTDFGEDLLQVNLAHSRLGPGYNGQTELFFVPWPNGEIRFRREADT